jgi:hypothetical protein
VALLGVIPWLVHGIQLKILKLSVFFIVFMDPVVKPRGDTVGFIGPRNNAQDKYKYIVKIALSIYNNQQIY